MAKLGTVNFYGKSKKTYEFDIWPFDSEWNEVAVVYAVTKRTQIQQRGSDHTVIYVGETENLKDRFSNHHKASCFTENDANCLCTHSDTSESSRQEKETDILAFYTTKCNDQTINDSNPS